MGKEKTELSVEPQPVVRRRNFKDKLGSPFLGGCQISVLRTSLMGWIDFVVELKLFDRFFR